MNNVGIIGAGYVGLTTAAGIATVNKKRKIVVFDTNEHRIEMLNKYKCPIVEPGLEEALYGDGNGVTFEHSITDAHVNAMSDIFVCVGTPSKYDGSVDLSQVESCMKQLLSFPSIKGKAVYIRSTVPPGTTRRLTAMAELNSSYDALPAFICHMPEFLQQGSALEDFMRGERVVCGVVDMQKRIVQSLLVRVSSLFPADECDITVVSSESSELAKYANNAFLATKISFANELARISDAACANYHDVSRIIGEDPRIGWRFLGSGAGYGGSCLPKDISGITNYALSMGLRCPVLDAAKRTNEDVYRSLVGTLIEYAKEGILLFDGVTFKRGTDDTRNSIVAAAIREVADRCGVNNVRAVDALAYGSAMLPVYPVVRTWEDITLPAHKRDVVLVLSHGVVPLDGIPTLLKNYPDLRINAVLDLYPNERNPILIDEVFGLNYIPFVG